MRIIRGCKPIFPSGVMRGTGKGARTMRMSMMVLAAVLAAACGLAQAQAYRWVDKDGKVRYGDIPPPGVKATPMKAPPGPASPAPGAGTASTDAAAKDAKKG